MRLAMMMFLVLFGLAGCANPSIVRVKDAEIKKLTISKIFIPRFEGNPAFVEESTDLFIAELEPNISKTIIQGSVLRDESTDISSGGNIVKTELALAKAKENGAQLLILGKVTSHRTGDMLNGFSTIRIINVVNGEVIANFHRPSGLLFANSEHQCVMAAVSRTAEDVATALK